MKSRKASKQGQNTGPRTLAIHAGEPRRHGVGAAVVTEICRSSTFTFSSTAEMKRWAEGKSSAYIYTRYGNPTLRVAEKKFAALEGAEAGVVTSSGMAAISSALLGALKQGDEVISTAQLYGGTYRLMRDVFPIWALLSAMSQPPSMASKLRSRRAQKFCTWKLPPIQRCAW
jgi:O-acetylhomoserine/O-acetylserine sulfhydrylase-like pyridoxal-dependent enzyme